MVIYPSKVDAFFHLKLIYKRCTLGKIQNLLEVCWNIFTMKTDLDTLLMPVSDLNIYDKMYYFFKELDEICDKC